MALESKNQPSQIIPGSQLQAAYQAVFGALPASMMDTKGENAGNLNSAYAEGVYPGATLPTPGGQQIDVTQLMNMYQLQQQQQRTGQATQALIQGAQTFGPGGSAYGSGAGTSGSQSYLGAPASSGFQSSGVTPMANGSPVINAGQVLYKQDGTPLTAAQTAQMMSLYSQYQAGNMQAGIQAANLSHSLGIGNLDAAVTNLQNQTGPNAAGNTVQPETAALGQMAGIDPQSEALRQQLAGSYADPSKAANPTAADYQSYLNTFKQVDPAEYAARAGLGTSMDSYLKSVQDQYALGSQLDPTTARQVEQQARAGQAARGNVYGTPQMVSEAMATGQAGEARLQQRQAALQAALGGQQSYLGSGLGLGDTAMQLYQQGLQNKANAQQSAMSYLSSGQTPYQAGASYLDRANANAASAAQGGPVYNPSALGAGQLGTAQQAPQYGLDVGAQAQNYFNSLNNAYGGGGAASKNKGAAAAQGALTGALGGASAGATLGSVIPGVGTVIGGVVGGVAGGALGAGSGYYS